MDRYRALIGRLRGAAFALVFYGGSVPFMLLVPLAGLGGVRGMRGHVRAWAGFHRWAAAAMLGIATRVEGMPPPGPALYAAKHQAMYETLELTRLLDTPAVVLKRELLRLPFWGWATRVYGAIPVDRAASATGLRTMLRAARAASAEGRSVLIFPEGTRVAMGEMPPLRPGLAGLYRALDLPVVPVALDSARRLPRRGVPVAGDITIRFGEPIPPGLPRAELEARVHAAINAMEMQR